MTDTNDEVKIGMTDEEFAARIIGAKPVITEQILEYIDQESKKPGFLSLDYKVNGTNIPKLFRGSISVYVTRSWLDDSLPVKTSKWIWGPRRPGSPIRKRIMKIATKEIESRPMSHRVRLFTIHNNKRVGTFEPNEWQELLARFSAAYAILQDYIDTLQKDKLVELKNGSTEFNEILESLGHTPATEEGSVPQGSGETTEEIKSDGNNEAEVE